MSNEENLDIPMAQCGACDAIVPLDSEACPQCGASFSGVSEETLGECGACGSIIPVDSESCKDCGAVFIEISQSEPEISIEEEVSEIEDPIPVSTADVMDEVAPVEVGDHTVDDLEETIHDLEPEGVETSDSLSDAIENLDSYIDEKEDPPAEVEESFEEIEAAVENEAGVEDETVAEVESIEEPEIVQNTEESNETIKEIDSEISTTTEILTEDPEEDIESLIDELEADDQEIETIEEETVDTTESHEELDSDDEEEVVEEQIIDESAVVMAFENLALAIAGSGMTAGEAFGEMDTSDDNLIDAPELQKGIQKIADEKLSPKEVTAILNYLDKDGNKRIDPNELVKALDDLKIGIKPGNIPVPKAFPSPVQKFLMGKKANDIFYPVAYFLMVTFIGLWVVNGMGLLVDGTGGTVVYEGGVDQWGGDIREATWDVCDSEALDEMIDPCEGTVAVGETYPCDPSIDANKCENSLTPFSGENGASSMPAGFYTDGIIMIVLGVIGIVLVAYLHLIYAPALREKARKLSGKSDEDVSDDESDNDEDEPTEDGDDPEDVEEDFEDDIEDLEDEDDIDEDDTDDEEDDIDIGSWIGLDIDGDEFFGEIIEFDDDEGTVTIETEDGEEITGDQDDMFIDDEDDE